MLCEVSGSKLVSREGGSKLGVEALEASLCAPCVLAGVRHGALMSADVTKSAHFSVPRCQPAVELGPYLAQA